MNLRKPNKTLIFVNLSIIREKSIKKEISMCTNKEVCNFQDCSLQKLICDMIKGMSRMSEILILSYSLKEVINSYVLRCF